MLRRDPHAAERARALAELLRDQVAVRAVAALDARDPAVRAAARHELRQRGAIDHVQRLGGALLLWGVA